MIKSRPATLRAVRARHRPFEISAEYLKIHHGVQPLQGITLGREFLQPLLNIEKPWLTPHPPPPSRTRLIESQSGQNDQVFGGVRLYNYAPGRGAEHAAALLKEFTSVLQTDGYTAYRRLANPKRNTH